MVLCTQKEQEDIYVFLHEIIDGNINEPDFTDEQGNS